tara:strand:+ start:3306 stop:3608 length:303 start_codon:yes stop_codon:yes gene_type:complete
MLVPSHAELTLINQFIEEQNLNFKPSKTEIAKLSNSNFRIDLAKNITTGLHFITSRHSWLQGKSYYLCIKDGKVKDLTIGAFTEAQMQAFLDVGEKGIKS